jgi:exonuclease III
MKSENYKIYWYGELSDRGGVGFAIKKQFVHLVKDVKGVPDSDGRIITMDILLHDPKHPVTVVGAYSPTNFTIVYETLSLLVSGC